MKDTTEQELSTKEHILQVVLEVVNTEGFEAVTIRKIAALAEVNVALVNYHFGSKEKLLNEAVKLLMNSFKDTFQVFDQRELPPKERLAIFLTNYASAFQKYPGLLRRLLLIGNISLESQYEFVLFLKKMGYHKIVDTLQEITGEQNQDQLIMMMVQLYGALVLPILMRPIIRPLTDIKLPEIESQVETLLNHYFSDTRQIDQKRPL